MAQDQDHIQHSSPDQTQDSDRDRLHLRTRTRNRARDGATPSTGRLAPARVRRRHVLALLAAVPAAVGLALVAERDGADARNKGGGKKHGHGKGKGKGKHKKTHKKKQRRRQRSGGDTGSAGYAPDAEERAFLDLINDYRRRNGAGPLALENRLGAAARNHSQDMAAKDYFSHKLSNGDSPEQNIERFGYTDYAVVGENIAAGVATAREVMNLWEDSAEHAHNMRDPEFSEIGIGRAHGGNSKYGWYWTTTFGGH